MTLQQLEREMVAQPIRSLQYMLNRLSLRYDFLPALSRTVCSGSVPWRR